MHDGPLAAPQLASLGRLGHFAATPRSLVKAAAPRSFSMSAAQPPALLSGLVSFAPLRTLSTGTAPSMPATATSAVIAPKCAAGLLVLGVLGVVDFVEKELKIDPDECKMLAKQKSDGPALLETSVDELRSFGMSAGAAHAIMRGIAPAVSQSRSRRRSPSSPRRTGRRTTRTRSR